MYFFLGSMHISAFYLSSPRKGCLVRNLFVSPGSPLSPSVRSTARKEPTREGKDEGPNRGVGTVPRPALEVYSPAAALLGSQGLL